MGTAVLFGAGNIGRGFLAQLFSESGLQPVFVDIADHLVSALNTHRAYNIEIVGPGAAMVRVDDVRAVHGRDRVRVAGEVAVCNVVSTSVGANALSRVAPALAAGLLARYKSLGTPVNVLICENLPNAADLLRSAVAEHLPDKNREAVMANTGFVQAVVSRMVPASASEGAATDPLTLRTEAYRRLPVDLNAIVGELPRIVGVEPAPDFAAHAARKLYAHNCGHAVLGYLGHDASFEYGWQALREPVIRHTLDQVLAATGEALVARYGFDPVEQTTYVADLLARFDNKPLGDTCRRLAQDPLRKLSSSERLVGAARLCAAEGLPIVVLADVIASALCYRDDRDSSAVELSRLIAINGTERALELICGISPTEPLGEQIMYHMHRRHTL